LRKPNRNKKSIPRISTYITLAQRRMVTTASKVYSSQKKWISKNCTVFIHKLF